jgi:hypothetical protein
MTTTRPDIIAAIHETIEIPDSAYETAEKRYKDVADWFGSGTARCKNYEPHITPQGSFRIGTVIRPLTDEEEYDLDLSCQLERGYSKTQHSQFELKTLVGQDLEDYRVARRIEQAQEEKNRCWRLRYKDQLKFHMDVVPCLPESAERRLVIREAMVRFGAHEALAKAVADLSVNITDCTLPNYRVIATDWPVSNPEGYARWFESRMKLAPTLLERRAFEARAATIDDLPTYQWKTPLQRSIQLLKRHRDVMFVANPDAKPISIIITTLAARAYRGESELAATMTGILAGMENLVQPAQPRVPNPVNPVEDFADKWDTTDGRRLLLERHFRLWVAQAKADVAKLVASSDPKFIAEQAMARFQAPLDQDELRRKFGIGFPSVVIPPKTVPITEPARPWRQGIG